MLPSTKRIGSIRTWDAYSRLQRNSSSLKSKANEIFQMKEELLAIALKDPLASLDDAKAKAFFDKYGSIEAIEGKLRLPNHVTSVRHVWRDHELSNEEVAALKDIVGVLQKTHAQLLSAHPTLAGILSRNESHFREATADINEPIRVAVTGASGNIGYALLYRLASGDAFGPRTPVILQLLELPGALNALQGVEMELRDCAFPTLRDVIVTDKPEVAFAGVDYALLVGAQPRSKGMERADLLMKNAEIFTVQGKALNAHAKGKDTRVIVVGNPANTNALIAQRNAPKIPPANFGAMTRLDHTRGLAQLSEKLQLTSTTEIKNFCIWGNHSATQFPDISHSLVFKNGQWKSLREELNDEAWNQNTFIPDVQQRGAAIIKARGASSAASAASALIDNVREWHSGTTEWTSCGVHSNGEYGVEKGLFFSYPLIFNNQKWNVVPNLHMNAFAQERIDATHKELREERDAVAKFLPKD